MKINELINYIEKRNNKWSFIYIKPGCASEYDDADEDCCFVGVSTFNCQRVNCDADVVIDTIIKHFGVYPFDHDKINHVFLNPECIENFKFSVVRDSESGDIHLSWNWKDFGSNGNLWLELPEFYLRKNYVIQSLEKLGIPREKILKAYAIAFKMRTDNYVVRTFSEKALKELMLELTDDDRLFVEFFIDDHWEEKV